MKNNFVTVLDFGSGKITCMAASRLSDSDEFIVKAVGQCAYGGFDGKGWLEADKLDEAIKQVIDQVESKMKTPIKEIYVGVPGAFCALMTSEASTTFHSKTKIDADNIAEIVKEADIYKCGEEYTLLSGKSVYFILDGAIKSVNPVGLIANKLTGLVSFSYMHKNFRNAIAPILQSKGISKVNYMSVCDAQASFVSSNVARDGYTIIIDVGHITTNVMLSGGRGLLFQRTFALGSGYFAADLYRVLGCDFSFATSILEKVNLNLEVKAGDAYSVNDKMVDASQVNAIVKARIIQIADYVKKSFQMCDRDIPTNTPVVITGGGLAYLRGGVDCLAANLGKRVKLYESMNPQINRNEYTSTYGLITEALRLHKNRSGILSIFKFDKGDK